MTREELWAIARQAMLIARVRRVEYRDEPWFHPGYGRMVNGFAYLAERHIVVPRPTSLQNLKVLLHEAGHLFFDQTADTPFGLGERQADDFADAMMHGRRETK
jgi:hypothetical protein